MDPIIGGAIIGGAMNTANGLFNYMNNKSQQQFSQDMYNKQRSDALSDRDWQVQYNNDMWNKNNQYNEAMWNKQRQWDIDKWNMQNEYNSPAAQMARFKAAGINPFAMFGNMSSGGAIDASQMVHASAPDAPSTRGSAPGSYNPAPYHFSTDGILSALDAKFKQAQVDNVKAQTATQQAVTIKTLADTENTGVDTDTRRFDLSTKSALRDTQIDAAKQALANSVQQNLLASQANERANAENTRHAAMFPLTMQKMRADIQNAYEDGRLKVSQQQLNEIQKTLHMYEVNLNGKGLQKNDGFFMRTLGNLWTEPLFKDGSSLKDRYQINADKMNGDWQEFGK